MADLTLDEFLEKMVNVPERSIVEALATLKRDKKKNPREAVRFEQAIAILEARRDGRPPEIPEKTESHEVTTAVDEQPVLGLDAINRDATKK